LIFQDVIIDFLNFLVRILKALGFIPPRAELRAARHRSGRDEPY